MNRVSPVFASTLAAFAGRASETPTPHKVLIAIEPMQVEVMVHAATRNGPAEYQMITAPDFAMKEAVAKVLTYPSVIDMIEAELAAMYARGQV